MTAEDTAVFVVPTSYGTGHVRRATRLAIQMLNWKLIAHAVVLSEYKPPCNWIGRYSITHVSLPRLLRNSGRKTSSASSSGEISARTHARAILIAKLVRELRPVWLFVDHLPVGMGGEVTESLQLMSSRREARSILLLRDVLGSAEVVRSSWDDHGHASALKSYFQEAWICGDADIYPAHSRYGLATLVPKVRYIGYTVPNPITRARNRRGILVTVGGGRDGRQFLSTALKALDGARVPKGTEIDVVMGPLMSCRDAEDLLSGFSTKSINIHRSLESMDRRLAEAELVVCMGGYNTLAEAAAARVKVICLPRDWGSGEQLIRAQLFESIGWITEVDRAPSALTLRAKIEHLLAVPPSITPDLPRLDQRKDVICSAAVERC